MYYQSTRSNEEVSSSYAILNGLASDGGLYVPKKIPIIDMEDFYDMNYQEIAFEVLRKYFTEFSEEELKESINKAYSTFDTASITEIKSFEKHGYLELFHGETLAFKDMALSLFPYLLLLAKKYQKETKNIFILTATSGDTGKAAMEAIKDVEGICINVIYPNEGVSSIQKEQMQKQEGGNVNVIAIDGNFDDAQSCIKEMFDDVAFINELNDNNYLLSSANSINVARLVPQIVYYIDAYVKLVKNNSIGKRDLIDVSVPTGNFGNILAAYLAKEMGVPINKLICASNENNILTDFINTGVYDAKREFKKTYSPSMDILISSNLERFLYFIFNRDNNYISKLMSDLKVNKSFRVNQEHLDVIKSKISAYYCSNKDCLDKVLTVYQNNNYLIDPHTAIAKKASELVLKDNEDNDNLYQLIVATASPYKFVDAVAQSLSINEKDKVNAINQQTGLVVPSNILKLKELPVRFIETIKNSELKEYIFNLIRKRN